MIRNSSIELLRLLLMVMIIIHHMIVHGLGYSDYGNNITNNLFIPKSQFIISTFINFLTIGSVNCFVLISGYFSINPSLRKIKNLIYILLFYTLIFNVIPDLIKGNINNAIINCFFLSHTPYWFVLDYLFLMIFTPMINMYFSSHRLKQLRIVMFGLIILSCYFGFIWGNPANKNGYTILQFIMMYCFGRWISIENIKLRKIYSLIGYTFSCLICTSIAYYFFINGEYGFIWRITYYNNPFLVVSSICLFLLFKDWNYHNSIINSISKSSLSIYLIQSSSLIATFMYKLVRDCVEDESWNIIWLYILIISILVTFLSILFDKTRQIIFVSLKLNS